MNMGEKIKELRKARGWSQTELGQRLGLQKSAISKYERGIITKFSQEQLEEIAAVFGVSPAVLFGYSEDEAEMTALIKRIRALPPDRVRQVTAFLDALEVIE